VPLAAPNGPLLIFDGDCSFCTSSAHWIRHRLPETVHVEPWQRLDLNAYDLGVRDVTTAAYWVDERGKQYRGHRSIGKALVAAGGVWKPVGALILVPPFSWLAAGVYAIIARNRSRHPGGTPECKRP
jgi:predicted DCC family thiol-disulfide oxidoreductase YuxK